MKSTIVFSLLTGAAAHGSMTHPRPRNAMSSPGTGPSTGADLSCEGDACYWYQVGCMIGCPTCQLDLDHKGCGGANCCTKSEGLMEPTNNDPEFRTWDPHGQAPNPDLHKYNPWRAPGKAPVADPCGVASGGTNPGTYAAIPQGYKAGDKGSEVLPEQKPTLWKAGATAWVGWGMSAQHAGGYSYRLCPKGSTISEECFQSNTLTFASKNSSIHLDNSTTSFEVDRKIRTRTYVAPDGTQWRTNPIPACISSTSQYPIHGSPTPDCPIGTMFEPGFIEFTQGFLVPGGKNRFSVTDEVNVPTKVGSYVLSWRWDCEEADQVWTSCADIEITNEPVPAPTPMPTPPEGTCPNFRPGVDSCSTKGCMTRDESGDCRECCEGCWWIYSSQGSRCTGGGKPGPKPGPSPPSPGPSSGDYLCYSGKCYNKPGSGTMDEATCEKTCGKAGGHLFHV
jgi:hypothetical protein